MYDEQTKIEQQWCVKQFATHKATLIQDTDRYFAADWRRSDGSGDYYANFIVDKKRGSLIISGDLGDCIATWYNELTPAKLCGFIEVGTPEDCLFPAKAWVYYKPEIRISETPDCKATAQMKNETYRIFRCKDCGRFVEISRGYDEHLISWGMKPFQRCEICRKKRKYPNSPWRWKMS